MSLRTPGLVNVIIPTYNSAHFLTEAIESVLLQDYSPIEILVVDDGSTDETASTVAALRGPIPCYRQFNQGAAAARHRGIAEASGAYIAFQAPTPSGCPGRFLRRSLSFIIIPSATASIAINWPARSDERPSTRPEKACATGPSTPRLPCCLSFSLLANG